MAIQKDLWTSYIERLIGLSNGNLDSRIRVHEREDRIWAGDLGVFVPILIAEKARKLFVTDAGIIYACPKEGVEPFAEAGSKVPIYTNLNLKYWLVLKGWYAGEFEIINKSSLSLPFGYVHLKLLNRNPEFYLKYCGLREELLPCRLDDMTHYQDMYIQPPLPLINIPFDILDIEL